MGGRSRSQSGGRTRRPGDPLRIGIVDDHPAVRRGLRTFLASQPCVEVCGEAGDAGAAIALVEERRPDLLVIDLSLEDGSGLELIKQIRARFADVRIVVYSMHDEKLFAERVLNAGAHGYVGKNEDLEVLVSAIDRVRRGNLYLSEHVTAGILTRRLQPARNDGLPSPRDLSDRELEVFTALGRGKSTREVAEQLKLSIKTIETHRENIKRKLGLTGNVELLHHAFQWAQERR